MTDLYDAALAGDLERVTLLVEQGVDKNQVGGMFDDTALSAAAKNNHFAVVQYLVEQGADMNKRNTKELAWLLCTILLYMATYMWYGTSWNKGRTGIKLLSTAGLPSTLLLAIAN